MLGATVPGAAIDGGVEVGAAAVPPVGVAVVGVVEVGAEEELLWCMTRVRNMKPKITTRTPIKPN